MKKTLNNKHGINKNWSHFGRLLKNFVLHLEKVKSFDEIAYHGEFIKDEIYLIEFEACSSNSNSLLEIIFPTNSGHLKVDSFIISGKNQKIETTFVPFNTSDLILFRQSSYGGFSPGSIQIKNLEIINLLPIKNSDELRNKIKLLGPWFHQINLKGIKTRDVFRTDSPSRNNGYTNFFTYEDYVDNPMWIWSKFKNHIPNYLEKKKVLDIACNCGFYSFELAKRGAEVTAFDNSYKDIIRAIFAKKVLGLKNIEFRLADVEKLEEEFDFNYDMILCLGLLYHLKDPKKIIKLASKLTNFAIFETIADTKNKESKLISDPNITSDGYLPTIPWLMETFKQVGFSTVTQVTPSDFARCVFICKK